MMDHASTISLRERCIAESLTIIAEDGIKNLSIREVARRLGVSHGAPYKHFANRDALITEIAIEGIYLLRNYLLTDVVYDSDVDPRENFMRLCRNYISFAMDQHDYFQLILWTDLPQNSDEYPRLRSAANELFAILYEMLNHVKTAYVLTLSDDEVAVLHILSTMHGYASLMSSGKLAVLDFNLRELEEHAHTVAKVVFDGLFSPLQKTAK